MRSIRMLAVLTGTLALVSACGDGGGGTPPPDNEAPSASFSEVCTQLSCVFTDTSTDPDGNGTITGWSWNFGDNTTANVQNPPAHVYLTAGAKIVVLTVTDDAGATNAFTKTVTVTGPPAVNQPPTASFDLPTGCTAGTPCGFHSTSIDADGTIATTDTDWNFGDGNTGEGLDATHTYAAAGTYTVTLTVTDNQGATGNATEQLIVSPAASQDCTTSGLLVDCTVTMTQRVTVKFTMVSRACELRSNRLAVKAPVEQTVFNNLCSRPVGEQYTLLDAGGLPLVLEAGTELPIQFRQGDPALGDPVPGDPGVQIEGSYPNWTLKIDDGGAPGLPGEPDFDDAVISVQATVAP